MDPIRIKTVSGTARGICTRRIVVVAIALVAVGLLALLLGPPLLARAAGAMVEKKIAEVARSLGREVSLRRISAGLSDALVMEGFSLKSRDGRHVTLSIERIEADFSLWDALWGRRAPSRMDLAGTRATLVLEQGRPREVMDLLGRLQGHLSGRATDNAPGADALLNLPEVRVAGEAVVMLADNAEPAARMRDLVLTVHRDGNGLQARFAAFVEGLGSEPARIAGSLTVRSLRDFTLEVRSGSPLEPTTLIRDILPVAARGKGVFVVSTPGQTVLRLEEIEVPELASLKGLPLANRLFSHAGLLSFSEVRVTFEDDVVSLARSGLSGVLGALRSLAVRDGAAHLVPAVPAVGPVRLRGVDATYNRDRGGYVAMRLAGEAAAGRLGFSRIEAHAVVSPDKEAQEVRLSLVGPILVEIVSGLHPRLLPWPGARVDLTALARRDGSRWGLAGHVAARNLAYFWTKACLVPVTNLALEADFQASADLAIGEFSVRMDPLWVGPARFALGVKINALHRLSRVAVDFSLPRQDCDQVARAIPRVLIPRLDGMRLQGDAGLEVRFVADLEKPERSSLSVEADVDDCRAITLGPLVDIERLISSRFVFEIHEKDLDKPIRVGPGTPSYVPIEEIPEVVQQAALATEDMAFFRHKGFRIGLINRAVKLNLSEGWYVYGGSTISQQLVKNLFLSREKTLARKLEEAIIVWEMERKVSKERILELYLNCIEFGRHIFGIRAAAQTYFGKEVRDLTPMEAAFIMATKPAPRYAYNVYKSRSFNDWWVKRMKGILERLWREMGVIDERAARTPDPCPPGGPRGRYLVPCFYYPEEGLYAQPAVAPGTEVPPGMPEDLPGGEVPATAPAPTAPKPTDPAPADPQPDTGT